jgi:starch synthase
MPSRYEPCGLGQLIAMRYGAIPGVRQTGGLADTVRDYRDNSPDANGFAFSDFTPSALVSTVARALSLYDQKSLWNALVSRAMISDFSWESSARQYLELFQRMV